MNLINAFLADDRGADLIEYALLAGLIALAMTTVLGDTRNAIIKIFQNINGALGTVGGGTGGTGSGS
jgi:pilus assembly protein Flp/PilA